MDSVTLTARALLFDMDGTLVDSTAVVESVWSRFALRHGIDVRDILKTSHGKQMKDTIAAWGPAGVDVSLESSDLAAFEITQNDGVIEVAGAADFANAVPRDAIALVTSAPLALAKVRMAVAGVDLPVVVVTADEIPRGKPHPDCYLRAAELLGVDPADAIVFEDADAGIAAGLAAGMRTIVVGDLDSELAAGLPRIRDYRDVAIATMVDTEGRRQLVLTLPATAVGRGD